MNTATPQNTKLQFLWIQPPKNTQNYSFGKYSHPETRKITVLVNTATQEHTKLVLVNTATKENTKLQFWWIRPPRNTQKSVLVKYSTGLLNYRYRIDQTKRWFKTRDTTQERDYRLLKVRNPSEFKHFTPKPCSRRHCTTFRLSDSSLSPVCRHGKFEFREI